jgi:transcriptional regulator with XRE-family HTH domain
MTSGQIKVEDTFVAAQCKAGRALLGWSQGDLANKASVAVSTVADFERGQRSPVPNNLEAMRRALEAEGIQFAQGGAVIRASDIAQLRSSVPSAELRPVRWVNEAMLDDWAQRIDARQMLPELVRRLLLARFGYGGELRFPSGSSIQLHGWDGLTNLKSSDALIPSGQAAWEMGVDKKQSGKAQEDYKSRTANPGSVRPAETTFVFVTPRAWGTKDVWVAERRSERIWRDVRVIDSVDLVQLLEQSPAVALWLANQAGRIPPNVRLLKDAWKEWSLSTELPLSEPLVLSGRDEESTQIHRWLNGPPAPIAFQAESTSEAIAFLHASISEYPTPMREAIESRALVVGSEEAAREITNVPLPLIIVASELNPGLASLLVSKGHHVFLAFGSAIGMPIDARTLPRPGRYAIAEELKALKVNGDEADRLARDSGRSLTVLRRLMKAAPGQTQPTWARSDQARRFLPILLAGAWDERNEEDKRVVSRLANISYSDLRANLTTGILLPESPVRFVGSTWKIASPRDAWFRLCPYLTLGDIGSFKETALEVLGKLDPAFEREDEHWFAIDDDHPEANSSYLKQGIVETITLIGVFGDQHPLLPHLQHVSDQLVRELLHGADGGRWWSLAEFLRELAEASPREFLDALDDSLSKNDPPVLVLFKEREDGLFGRAYHSDLLWALEMLAWSPDYLARVTSILLRLAEIDPKGRWANRPSNSLRQIYVLWHPQTYVKQDDRLQLLDTLRTTHPRALWDLLLDLYPKGNDSASQTPKPLWRSFEEPERSEAITNRSVWSAATKLGEWLFEEVGLDPERWEELIGRFGDLAPDLRKRFFKLAQTLPNEMTLEADRDRLRAALRGFIHRHRQFSQTDWAIPEDELSLLEGAHDSLQSSDVITRHCWLFSSEMAPLLRPPGMGWEENGKASREARQAAMTEILERLGVPGVRQLAEAVVAHGLVGRAVADAANDTLIHQILGDLFRVGDDVALNVGFGLVMTLSQRGEKGFENVLIDRSLKESWPDRSVGVLLSALPQTVDLQERIKLLAAPVQSSYWRTVSLYRLDENGENFDGAIEGLLAHDRAFNAAELVVGRKAQIDSGLIVRILDGILATQDRLGTSGNDATMLQFYVEQLFLRLDKDSDFNRDELGRLEWAYLKLLDDSSRPPASLHHRLSSEPAFFCEVISVVYGAKDTPQEELSDEDRERQKNVASNAYTLLHSWHEIPGTVANSVRYELLEKWVREAQKLCDDAGRVEIAEEKIGEVLVHALEDEDGTWPCVSVRRLIEAMRNSHIENGFYIGTLNNRGVTSRGVLDGGELERQEAKRYRSFAKAVRLQWPRTAAVLERIALSYDATAKSHDQDAERRQWN